MEIYKPVTLEDYKNYHISTKGNVKNSTTGNVLKNNLKMGYHYASFHGKDGKCKSVRVHRLVALAFIPNDDEKKTFVNHINGIKTDNNVTNLEWVTPSGNVQHAIDTKLIKSFERKVSKYDLEGNLIETYNSIKEASEKNKLDGTAIVKNCKGVSKTSGGFKWEYHEKNERDNFDGNIGISKPINEYENYKITSDGKVYNTVYKKFLKTRVTSDGYEDVNVSKDNKKKTYLVHRLVAIHFIPKTEDDILNNRDKVNHKNGNKLDNTVENLEWVTDSENIKHMYASKKK